MQSGWRGDRLRNPERPKAHRDPRRLFMRSGVLASLGPDGRSLEITGLVRFAPRLPESRIDRTVSPANGSPPRLQRNDPCDLVFGYEEAASRHARDDLGLRPQPQAERGVAGHADRGRRPREGAPGRFVSKAYVPPVSPSGRVWAKLHHVDQRRSGGEADDRARRGLRGRLGDPSGLWGDARTVRGTSWTMLSRSERALTAAARRRGVWIDRRCGSGPIRRWGRVRGRGGGRRSRR